MQLNNRVEKIDELVQKLYKEEDKWMSLAIAVDLADEIMKGILPDKNSWHEKLNRNAQEEAILPEPLNLDTFNTKKQKTWFVQHPVSQSARVALDHFSAPDCPLESRLYWFSEKSTKQRIAAATQFFTNWEDSELTRNDNYKVAIDFFLTADANTFIIVVTNEKKLRVMELNKALSNTQKQIFSEKLFTIPFLSKEDKTKSAQEVIHAQLWDAFWLREVNNKFYKGISELHTELSDYLIYENNFEFDDAVQFSSRLLGRLLFLWFLRKMDLIDEDMAYFSTGNYKDSSEYYEKSLKPLFFRTLNTPINKRDVFPLDNKTPYLNGGLFDEKENDFKDKYIEFPDNYFDKIYDHFSKFNFTIDESSTDYQLVAVDPEMLGQVFESLLASRNKDDDISERNKTGAFYTPRQIVEYMCKEAIRQYLYRQVDNENYNKGIDNLINWTDAEYLENKSTSNQNIWGVNTEKVTKKILDALDNVKIIDPAVGSGAFPIGMMQLINKLYQRLLQPKYYNPYKIKRAIIENNIYGVDINPMAVEIARLRAWLALIVDDYKDNAKIHTLPNLEFKFVSANSLEPLLQPKQIDYMSDQMLAEKLEKIRDEYFNEDNPSKKKKLQEKYHSLLPDDSVYENDKVRQIKTFDPFDNTKSARFYDSKFMFGIKDGFDIVIGNPPYIHFEKMDKPLRDYYKKLSKEYYETFEATGDIYTLFYEHGMNLLKKNGILVYITSNKWMRTKYGKKLRNYFVKKTNPLVLIDLGGEIFEHATVDTNILVLAHEQNNKNLKALTLESDDIYNELKNDSVNINYKENEMWTILNPIEISIKDKIEAKGKPLNEWDIDINYGIKTGRNEAFIIDENTKNKLIKKDKESQEIIEPILRGKDIDRYSVSYKDLYLINTHNGYFKDDATYVPPIDINDYPVIKKYLDSFGSKITDRYDQGYTPYNLRNCAYMDKMYKPKIIYSEIVQYPKFYYDRNADYFVEATAFLVTGENLDYLIHILNSYVMAWIFKKFYAGGGLGEGFRYKKAYLNKLPVYHPEDNPKINEDNIDEYIYKSYGFTSEEIEYIKEQVAKEFDNE